MLTVTPLLPIPTSLSTDFLIEIADYASSFFNLERISCYATPQDILEKSKKELKKIREAGFSLLYVGIESGDDEILKNIRKGVSSTKLLKHALKPRNADSTCL